MVIPERTTGLDVGDRYSWFHTLDRDGETQDEGRVRTDEASFRTHFTGARRRIVLETGPQSPWISRLLASLGHEVIVANARMVSLISRHPRKSDRVDAETLARLGRVDPKLLAPIHHRGERAQVHLGVLRGRDAVVRTRTALVNHVRGTVKAMGGRVPGCSTASFAQRASAAIPEAVRPTLEPILETIRDLNAQVRAFDRQIEGLCEDTYPDTDRLRQIAGVGPVTALAYWLVVEDPSRFASSRAVGAYLGLTRRRDESGESQPELRISKAGDKLVRRLLTQAAHYVLGPFGPDTDLRRWGQELAKRGGGTKKARRKAVIAVARKLAVLMHHLWATGEQYEPLRMAGHTGAKVAA